MKLIIISIVALVAMAVFASCKGSSKSKKAEVKTIKLWVNSHRPDSPNMMYSVQYGEQYDSASWQDQAMDILGFDYQPGIIYQIEVSAIETTDEGPLSYKLERVLSTEVDVLMQLTDIYIVSAMPGFSEEAGLKNTRCMVELNAGDMKVMGQGFCNNFSGKIMELSQDLIQFGPMMATKKACPELKLEQQLFKRLGAVRSYEKKNLMLHLKSEDGKSILVLKKVD